MMEKEFVDAILKTIRTQFPKSTVVRPSDSYTLGIPDVLAWIPIYEVGTAGPRHEICRPWAVAIEAKALHPLMADPFHRGRRTGQMLEHPFTGPQVSLLRMMVRSSIDAFGLVRASDDTAFRIHPDDIPGKTGNFTHEELVAVGKPIRRMKGLWQFWEEI
jgi:hypothetical protein